MLLFVYEGIYKNIKKEVERIMLLEVCVGNYVEAMTGFKNGGNRIELCDNLQEGGTTPSYGTVKKVMEDVNIPVNVIIRPRGGDFNY
ncbi:MAG: copper homeostasis protein CutC, partial [Comamonas sp.]